MPLDPAFVADCFYDSLLIDEILEVDRGQSFVRARMPTHADLPLTNTQRVHPVRHPRHVSGALMVHMTGMMGFAHAYYVLDLRHADGWVGYGVRIDKARFVALAPPGEPLVLECRATQVRKGSQRTLGKYSFKFTQSDKLVYESEQTALWVKVPEDQQTPLAL
jgi:3-hydroxymyristoyl/3-hydroxydecanoyl-(acyl carrier protein) dehydratase